MDNSNEKKVVKKLPKEHIEEEQHKHHRSENDMPRQYQGSGPQENSAIGYDALEDI